MQSDRRPAGVVKRQTPPEDSAEPTTVADMLQCYGTALECECHVFECTRQVYRLSGTETCLAGHDQRSVPTHE